MDYYICSLDTVGVDGLRLDQPDRRGILFPPGPLHLLIYLEPFIF